MPRKKGTPAKPCNMAAVAARREATRLVVASKPADAKLTRRGLAAYLTYDLGRPTTLSTLNKISSLGEGPPVDEWWGHVALYTRQTGKTWSDARARKTKPAPVPASEAGGRK